MQAWAVVAITVINLVLVWRSLHVYERQAASMVDQSAHLAKQTRLLRESADSANRINRVTASHVVNDTMHTVNQVFLQYPNLRQCFYGDAPMPRGAEDRERAIAISDMLLDLASLTLDLKQHNVVDVEAARGWEAFFCYVMEGSETMHYWYSKTADWWEPPVVELFAATHAANCLRFAH